MEAIVKCMTHFPSNALVQLSALLCLIPLALDNTSLQAHVATIALPAVVSALRAHREHADVQAKGLVVLGVLGQVTSQKMMYPLAAHRRDLHDMSPSLLTLQEHCTTVGGVIHQ